MRTKKAVMHGKRMVIQDKFNRRMGRGHSINLYSALKPLLHTECQRACLTSSTNMHTLLLELGTINQLRQALHGQWHMNVLSVRSQQLSLLGPHNKYNTKSFTSSSTGCGNFGQIHYRSKVFGHHYFSSFYLNLSSMSIE